MIAKFSIVLLILAICSEWCSATSFSCSYNNTDPVSAVCLQKSCFGLIESHIQEELSAAFLYLDMATIFDQSSENRRGLAQFLYKAASEERQHAMMMLDYMNQRGYSFDRDFSFLLARGSVKDEGNRSKKYRNALTTALEMEILVTDKIFEILDKCNKDLHVQDKFTDPVMDEQHHGIRKIQGAIRQFDNMVGDDLNFGGSAFSVYLFDQMLLKGEVLA